MNLKSLASSIGVACALLVASTAGFAQKTTTIYNGVTTVQLSNPFLDTLSSNKVTPGTVFPTQLFNGTVDFPITGGAVDLATYAGNILHSGGLTLSAGGTVVTLQSFIIDTTPLLSGGTPVISGLVSENGTLAGRLPLFNVSLTSDPVLGKDGSVKLTGVNLTLTATAAGALSGAFFGGSTAVTKELTDLPIGTASVYIYPSIGNIFRLEPLNK